LLDGVFANLDPAKSFVGKFLYATYPIQSGTAHFATAILPHKNPSASPVPALHSGSGFKGMSLSWGAATDSFFTADTNAGPVSQGATSWNATGCYVRNEAGQLTRFLADNAVSFSHGNALFTSSSPAVVIGDARSLSVSVDATASVQFRWPGAGRAFVDHSASSLAADGNGIFSTSLAAGIHVIHFSSPSKPSYGFSMRGDTVLLGVKGLQAGKSYRHETSTDLLNWSLIKTGIAPAATDLIADPVDAPKRFYRMVLPEGL
jgi:hypothetical protein